MWVSLNNEPASAGVTIPLHVLRCSKWVQPSWLLALQVQYMYSQKIYKLQFNIYLFMFCWPCILIYVVCLESSVNGTRKQTKQEIQTN
jgi:hypothetical protein